jgi:TRAP-type C4-dicarboxylate transport system permease small subunit
MAEQVQVPEKVPERSKPNSRFNRILLKISKTMSAVGAVVFLAMMLITVTDVVGRSAFLHPLEGASELVGLLLVIGATWGMGYCQLNKMHIRINIFTEKMSQRNQKIFWIMTYLVSSLAAGGVAWQGIIKTAHYITATRGQITNVLEFPYWPFWLLMTIGFAWVCFIFLIELGRSFKGVFKK